jgi:hypothetical protein
MAITWRRTSRTGRQQLAGAPDRLRLPADCPPPFRGVVQRRHGLAGDFPQPVVAALRALCEREGATPFMVFGAVLFVLLHRLSGETDLCIGSPVAGRPHPELESVIGLFVNTIVLRCRFETDLTFGQLLAQVKQTTLEAYDHQDLPFERLVDELQIQRLPDRSPIYQLLYVHQESALPKMAMTDLAIDSATGPCRRRAVRAIGVFHHLAGSGFLAARIQHRRVRARPQWRNTATGSPSSATSCWPSPSGRSARPVRASGRRPCPYTSSPRSPSSHLEAHLDYWLRKWNLPARLTFAPYAQIFQQMLDPESAARRNREGANLFLVRFEDWVQGIEGEAGLAPARRKRPNLSSKSCAAPAAKIRRSN